MEFKVVAGAAADWTIGIDGKVPWNGSSVGYADKKFFRSVTLPHGDYRVGVFMGSKTFAEIGKKLQRRVNVVISRKVDACGYRRDGVYFVNSFDKALELLREKDCEEIYCIGGGEVYRQAMCHHMCRELIIARVPFAYGDVADNTPVVRMPIPAEYGWHLNATKDIPYTTSGADTCNGFLRVESYTYVNESEEAFRKELRRVISMHDEKRTPRLSRAGRVFSVFGVTLRFPLHDPLRGDPIIPLMTSKWVNFRAVYHELVWFLRASRETSYLREHGVKFWDGNTSAEYHAKYGHDLREGETGPIYGAQWREWLCADGSRIDQVAGLIKSLQEDPMGRRHLVTAWNPADIKKMCLPPCHYAFQMYVEVDEAPSMRLNCLVQMRSGDSFLGIPCNVASYALLTHIIAGIVGMAPGELMLCVCDFHLYVEHITPAKEMLRQPTRMYPKWNPIRKYACIDDFAYKSSYDEVRPVNYVYSKYIPAGMNA